MTSVTVKELDELIAKLAAKELEVDQAQAVLTERNKEYSALEGRIVNYMNDLDRDKYDSPHGKVSIVDQWRVSLPSDDIAKKELFEHLRERGIFDKYATVNSNSLNALYMADWREAQERGDGMTFAMPGILAPKLHKRPKFKAVK